MSWQRLESIAQIGEIVRRSSLRPQLIFKHSTRCSISAAAKYRLEAETEGLADRFDLYYLDLLAHRGVSDAVADRLDVPHRSPQVLVIDHGKAIFSASHYDIEPEKLARLALSH
ncbi:MAG: bacillithiol system redox-active protein YtxJ [Bacteroidota bacterium]